MMALAAQDLADGDQESEHQSDLAEVSDQQLRRLCTDVTSCKWSSFAIGDPDHPDSYISRHTLHFGYRPFQPDAQVTFLE
jgi:hypothetical protein